MSAEPTAAAPLGRLPQLDGLRAVAIALVVLAHVGFLVRLPLGLREALSPVLLGDGVALFFVLSGYLITTILLRERLRRGRADLRMFYVRRALRIWPAFYVFLAVTAALVVAGRVAVSGRDLALAALYLWDYVPRTVPWVQHTWSLAIEEQFYLLWPFVLSRVNVRTAFAASLAGVAADPFVRMATWHLGSPVKVDFMLHSRADALLIGCALALFPAAFPAGHDRFVGWVRRARADLIGAVGFLVAVPYLLSPWLGLGINLQVQFAFGLSLEVVTGGLLLAGLLHRPGAVPARLLTTPLLRHLGAISYSLYLWQEPFLVTGRPLPLWLRLGGALVAAEASYWLVERPFLRLKDRFSGIEHRPEPRQLPGLAAAE